MQSLHDDAVGFTRVAGRARIDGESDDVVDDGGIARRYLVPGDESILGQSRIDEEAAVFVIQRDSRPLRHGRKYRCRIRRALLQLGNRRHDD